jgi:hypothetical protein
LDEVHAETHNESDGSCALGLGGGEGWYNFEGGRLRRGAADCCRPLSRRHTRLPRSRSAKKKGNLAEEVKKVFTSKNE